MSVRSVLKRAVEWGGLERRGTLWQLTPNASEVKSLCLFFFFGRFFFKDSSPVFLWVVLKKFNAIM